MFLFYPSHTLTYLLQTSLQQHYGFVHLLATALSLSNVSPHLWAGDQEVDRKDVCHAIYRTVDLSGFDRSCPRVMLLRLVAYRCSTNSHGIFFSSFIYRLSALSRSPKGLLNSMNSNCWQLWLYKVPPCARVISIIRCYPCINTPVIYIYMLEI